MLRNLKHHSKHWHLMTYLSVRWCNVTGHVKDHCPLFNVDWTPRRHQEELTFTKNIKFSRPWEHLDTVIFRQTDISTSVGLLNVGKGKISGRPDYLLSKKMHKHLVTVLRILLHLQIQRASSRLDHFQDETTEEDVEKRWNIRSEKLFALSQRNFLSSILNWSSMLSYLTRNHGYYWPLVSKLDSCEYGILIYKLYFKRDVWRMEVWGRVEKGKWFCCFFQLNSEHF